MSELNKAFQQAQHDVQSLPVRPENQTLLQLYGLYKQATEGDVQGPAPGFFDFVGTAKYEAWAALTGTEEVTAMQRYVELVETLRG